MPKINVAVPQLPNNGGHPECRPGEIFITNLSHQVFDLLPWKTKRAGARAIDSNGAPVTSAVPIFIQRSEWDMYWQGRNGTHPELAEPTNVLTELFS